jgi:type I restriction enzyme S subunit
MNRIDYLIAQLCPQGVEFKSLGEVLDYEQPGKYLVVSTAYDKAHETPVLTAGQTFILGYTDETAGIYSASPDAPVVIFDDFTTAFKWVDFPFKAKSSAMKMLTAKRGAGIDFKYVFYVMQTIRYEAQDHARQWIGTYSRFRVPIPPLDVQREIVRILDTFTSLEAELEAELEARKRQYSYYRDALMSFPEGDVQRVPMGEFAQLVRGNGMPKTDFADDGVGAIHYGHIYTHYGTFAHDTLSFVAPETATKLAKVDRGDIVITNTSENIDDVGKAVAWLGENQVVTGGHATVIKHEQNPKFLAYYFQSTEFAASKRQHVTGTKVMDVSAKNLAKIEVPLPPLEQQERIAGILDNFDALVNDLSVGLPAELKARRKQYEYYRDKLLTFQEAAV